MAARARGHGSMALAWWYTGPAGHLLAGALDVGSLLVRLAWARARGRRIDWF